MITDLEVSNEEQTATTPLERLEAMNSSEWIPERYWAREEQAGWMRSECRFRSDNVWVGYAVRGDRRRLVTIIRSGRLTAAHVDYSVRPEPPWRELWDRQTPAQRSLLLVAFVASVIGIALCVWGMVLTAGGAA